jgi:DNA repair protein RecO (recombination protein O)
MALLRCPAIVCSVRHHGEHGVIARLLTPRNGLLAGYVRGGRSTQFRPVLIPGNMVEAEFRARTQAQLPGLTVELIASRAPWLSEPLASEAIAWSTGLAASSLAEGEDHPEMYPALSAVLDAICHAPSARGWAAVLLRYESLMLRALGSGRGAAMVSPDAPWADLLDAFRFNGRALSRQAEGRGLGEALAARERLERRLQRTVQ